MGVTFVELSSKRAFPPPFFKVFSFFFAWFFAHRIRRLFLPQPLAPFMLLLEAVISQKNA